MSQRGQVAPVDLVERPFDYSLVFAIQHLGESLQDLAKIDQSPAQGSLDDMQAG